MSDDPATEVKALASDPIVTGILDRLRSGLDASLAITGWRILRTSFSKR